MTVSYSSLVKCEEGNRRHETYPSMVLKITKETPTLIIKLLRAMSGTNWIKGANVLLFLMAKGMIDL